MVRGRGGTARIAHMWAFWVWDGFCPRTTRHEGAKHFFGPACCGPHRQILGKKLRADLVDHDSGGFFEAPNGSDLGAQERRSHLPTRPRNTKAATPQLVFVARGCCCRRGATPGSPARPRCHGTARSPWRRLRKPRGSEELPARNQRTILKLNQQSHRQPRGWCDLANELSWPLGRRLAAPRKRAEGLN